MILALIFSILALYFYWDMSMLKRIPFPKLFPYVDRWWYIIPGTTPYLWYRLWRDS